MTKVLVVVYYNYHLYNFLKPLVNALENSGLDITFLSSDPVLIKKYKSLGNVKMIHARQTGRAMNIMHYGLLRPFVWLYGWLWSFWVTRSYDLVISPTDNKPFYHMITSWKPSIICQSGIGNHDKKYLQHIYCKDVPMPNPNFYISGKHKKIDRLFGGSFYKNIRGPKNKKHYTVTGPDIKHFYSDLGIPDSHIHIVGNPNYHGLSINNNNLTAVKNTLDAEENTELYSFFSSQLNFYPEDLAKLDDYLHILFHERPNAFFCFKIHPRVNDDSYNTLLSWAQKYPKIRIIKELPGDQNNLHLIHLSRAVFIEDSNVGILAMHHEKPVFIIDLESEKYTSKSLYLFYEGTIDCTMPENLKGALCEIQNQKLIDIISAQNKMADQICVKSLQPCQTIAQLCPKILLEQ